MEGSASFNISNLTVLGQKRKADGQILLPEGMKMPKGSTHHNDTAGESVVSGAGLNMGMALSPGGKHGQNLHIPGTGGMGHMHTPLKRKSISLKDKQEALKWIETEGEGVPSRAEKHFRAMGWNVSASCFRKWWRMRDQIRSTSAVRKRLGGGGRKPELGKLEDQLYDAVRQRVDKGERVTRGWISTKAKEIFANKVKKDGEEFKASTSWVTNFMRRYNFSLGDRVSLWEKTELYAKHLNGDQPSAEKYLNFLCKVSKFHHEPEHITSEGERRRGPALRELKRGDMMFNYGVLPRTWSNPDVIIPDVELGGNDEALDVIEIGMKFLKPGSVYTVKVLGAFCLLFNDRVEWKIVAIKMSDPWAKELADIEDVEKKIPGLIETIREWFRKFRVPDGFPESQFGFEEKFMNKQYTMEIIKLMHESWVNVVNENLKSKPHQAVVV